MVEISLNLCKKMEQIVQKIISLHDPARLLTPYELADRLGYKIKRGISFKSIEGLFHEDSNTILINEDINLEERKLFSIYHELCHGLIREEDEFFSDLHDLYENDNEFTKVIERLCDIGACEFLLPRKELLEQIYTHGLSIRLLPDICSKYKVSKQMALRRLAECGNDRCVFAICSKDISYSPQTKEVVLHNLIVENSWNTSKQKYFLKKGSTIPKDHKIWNYVDSPLQSFTIKDSFIEYRSKKRWKCYVEGIWLSSRLYLMFKFD